MNKKEKSIFWTAVLITLFTNILGFIYPRFIVEKKYKDVAWKGFWWTVLFGIAWGAIWSSLTIWFFKDLDHGFWLWW